MNPCNTLLDNAPDLLEHVGVLLVHPVCQVTAVIKDLKGNTYHLLKRDTIINTEKHEIPQWSHGRIDFATKTSVFLFVSFTQLSKYHVRLPTLCVDATVNTPPEIILRLPLPGKHSHS